MSVISCRRVDIALQTSLGSLILLCMKQFDKYRLLTQENLSSFLDLKCLVV